MQRVLVTGGAGFIGSHLTRRLVELGFETVVLDDLSSGRRENVDHRATFVEGSVLDAAAVAATLQEVDVCVHLAAIASVALCNERLAQSHAVNIGGFLQLIEAARASRPYVIFASSCAAYGDAPGLPLREDGPATPLSPYGADKLACELHARAAQQIWSLSSTGFRFFNVFGPGQDPASPYSGVIAKFADRLLRGEPLRIDGDGRQSRDFVYIVDVVDELAEAVKRRLPGANLFNLCTGRETSILELAQTMATVFDRPPTVEFELSRDGDIRHSVGSRERYEKALGLRSAVEMAAGLQDLRRSLATPYALPRVS